MAAVLALAAALCLSVPVLASAGDIESGTLSVVGDQLTGKKVVAVRMFTADVDNGDDGDATLIDEDDTVGYTLESGWLPFFRDKDLCGEDLTTVSGAQFANPASPTDAEIRNAARMYIEKLTNNAANVGSLAAFANRAYDYAVSIIGSPGTLAAGTEHPAQGLNDLYYKTSAAAQPVSNTGEYTNTTARGTAVIENLVTGYYLVFPDMGSTGLSSRGTDAMLVNVPTAFATDLVLKSAYPTVSKTVDAAGTGYTENDDARVGDTVTFKLEATVPDMSDYTSGVYQFKFVDTLSAGLTLDQTSIVVLVKETPGDDGDYMVTVAQDMATPPNTTLTIAFSDLKTTATKASALVGDPIEVTYDAVVNTNALSGDGDPADPFGVAGNSVKIVYSTSPDGTQTGESIPDESKVYNYDTVLDVFDRDVTSDKLPGGYHLEDGSGNPIPLIKISDDVYRVATAKEIYDGDLNITTTITTPESTSATPLGPTIKGLELGDYTLVEETAPDGYNPVGEVNINIALDGSDNETPVYTVEGVPNALGDNVIKVPYSKGNVLPATGGAGTIVMTVLGAAVVIGGVYLGSKNRGKKKEKP